MTLCIFAFSIIEDETLQKLPRGWIVGPKEKICLIVLVIAKLPSICVVSILCYHSTASFEGPALPLPCQKAC